VTLIIEATAWRNRPGPRCLACLGPMPADLAEQEGWTYHPACDPRYAAFLAKR
jgi:hypothetical protein